VLFVWDICCLFSNDSLEKIQLKSRMFSEAISDQSTTE
jgi:hypothetical protein